MKQNLVELIYSYQSAIYVQDNMLLITSGPWHGTDRVLERSNQLVSHQF